jgi:hypothetical protein
MTEYHFTNNIGILYNKPYYEFLKNKNWNIILYQRKTNNKTIKDNNYSKVKDIPNFIYYSYYLKQLGIVISKFVDNCITIKYLNYELKLYIFPYNYDTTIRNLKFECSKYSVSEKIEEYLRSFIDENWDLILGFIEDNNKIGNNCLEKDELIPNLQEVSLN